MRERRGGARQSMHSTAQHSAAQHSTAQRRRTLLVRQLHAVDPLHRDDAPAGRLPLDPGHPHARHVAAAGAETAGGGWVYGRVEGERSQEAAPAAARGRRWTADRRPCARRTCRAAQTSRSACPLGHSRARRRGAPQTRPQAAPAAGRPAEREGTERQGKAAYGKEVSGRRGRRAAAGGECRQRVQRAQRAQQAQRAQRAWGTWLSMTDTRRRSRTMSAGEGDWGIVRGAGRQC